MDKLIVEKFMISKEDLKNYFNNRKTISTNELIEYYQKKEEKLPDFFPT